MNPDLDQLGEPSAQGNFHGTPQIPEATFIIAELPDGRYTAWLAPSPIDHGEDVVNPREDIRSLAKVMAQISEVVADAGLHHFEIQRQTPR